MATQLKEEFVERRSHAAKIFPTTWGLDVQGQYYELDLKMCQLKTLEYTFEWGKEGGMLPRMASIIETPSRIIRLDLSLNELIALDHRGLTPFRNLRELNASLNRISNFIGIEVLRQLYTLNLSHNFIKKIDNLVSSPSLRELNLSMNELTDISYMPSMINLEVLNISNNKVRSLNGIQALVKLRELYCQRNDIDDLIPLASCFHMHIVNAADNHITTLHNTADVLAQLKRLEVLNLHGNPMERDPMYRTELLRSTNVMTLDNISVRPLPKRSEPEMMQSQFDGNYKHKQNINTLKEAATQAFEERLRDAKSSMSEQVNFLQKRILELQSEHQEYEVRLRNDLDSCQRYLDTLHQTEIGTVSKHEIRDSMGTPAPKPWHRHHHHRPDKADYTGITDTDQILKLARAEIQKSSPVPGPSSDYLY